MRYTTKNIHSEILCSFGCFRRRFAELGAKDCVPEAARNTEAQLEVCVVVPEVVFLELVVVGWKTVKMISSGFGC